MDPAPVISRTLRLLTVAAILLLFWRLGEPPLWDRDETKYAGIAREIVRTGDWITLHWNGEAWFVHPPLWFWLTALTDRVVGSGEFSARLWSAVSGAGGVGLTYLLARDLFGMRCGLLAAFVLATTVQWFAQGRLAVFDPLLVGWMLLALRCLYVGYAQGSGAAYRWASVAAALGTLTKGFVAALLPAGTFLLFLAIRRELGRLRGVPWLGVIGIYVLLGGGWYAVQGVLHGETFVRTALGYYTLNRYFGVVEGQSGPLWYYVPVLLLGGLPWSAFYPLAVLVAVRNRSDPRYLLLLTWCAVGFAFFSLAGTKLPNYVLGLYPVAAVLVGRTLEPALFAENPHELRSSWALLGGLCVLFAAAAIAYGLLSYPSEIRALIPALAWPLAALAAGATVAAGLGVRGASRPAALVTGLSVLLFFALALAIALPAVDRYRSGAEVGRTARALVRPEDARIGYRTLPSLVTYSGLHWRYAYDAGSLRSALCGLPPGRRVVIVTPEPFYDPGLFGGLRVIGRVRDHLFLERPGGGRLVKACEVRRTPSAR